MRRGAWFFFALLIFSIPTGVSFAQSGSAERLSTSAQQVRTAILFGSADTQSAVERANAEVRALYRRLGAEVAAKEKALKSAGKSERERRRLSAEVGELRRDQEHLMVQLAAMDVEYKSGIRAFREGLNGLLETPDPRILAALRRYSEGDVSALDELQQITRIIRAAREAGLKARNGEEQRAVARLWTDAMDLGRKTQQQALDVWQEAATIDPDNFESWQLIAQLSFESGDFARAEFAGKKALSAADGPAKEGAALLVVGNAISQQGRLAEAREFHVRSVTLARKSVSWSPGGGESQRDLSAALNNFGDVEKTLGNLDSAESAYQEAIAIRRQLQALNPKNDRAHRALAVALTRIGVFLWESRDRQAEARLYLAEALPIFREIERRHPDSSVAQFDTLLALKVSANLTGTIGDVVEAQQFAKEGLKLAQSLQRRDPTNARFRIEMRSFMDTLGVIALRENGYGEARDWFEEQLSSARKDVASAPLNFRYQMDVVGALLRLIYLARIQGRASEVQSIEVEVRSILNEIETRTGLSRAERQAILNVRSQL
jgi:tetratricopeptide (TPR) repeat protein